MAVELYAIKLLLCPIKVLVSAEPQKSLVDNQPRNVQSGMAIDRAQDLVTRICYLLPNLTFLETKWEMGHANRLEGRMMKGTAGLDVHENST